MVVLESVRAHGVDIDELLIVLAAHANRSEGKEQDVAHYAFRQIAKGASPKLYMDVIKRAYVVDMNN